MLHRRHPGRNIHNNNNQIVDEILFILVLERGSPSTISDLHHLGNKTDNLDSLNK